MGLIAKDSGGGDGFEQLAPGAYTSRCVTVADIGVQDTGFGSKEKVYLGFEVPSERVSWKDKDGVEHEGPAFIGSRYTLSIHEKSILGQQLTSWRGVEFTPEEREGFDVFSVLGAPCLINVIHVEKNNKIYANIQTIMRMPKGMVCPEAETPLLGYTPLDQDKIMVIDKLPPWLQKLCREGYKIAEGSHVIGSAGGPMPAPPVAPVAPVAPATPVAPAPPPTAPPVTYATAAEAMAAAEAAAKPPAGGPEDFDDDIPF